MERFGRDEVLAWRFECWNEPNLRGCFFDGTQEDFFRLWSATWRAVKSVHPDLRFGGPSTARGWAGEVHWNEWGRSWFPHDPKRETALDAAFAAKTMDEVSQEADAFAYWSLSDIYDQVGYQSSEFQAHYGMLSLHGLRKPVWHAHALLHRLGDRRVAVAGAGPLAGAIATPDAQDGGSVLVWRYPAGVDAPVTRGPVEVVLPPLAT
jgi:xylan 1,4-beta-xylosidase